MEQLSIKIANILLRNKYIEEAMYSVYQYGIQMAFEVGCSFIMSIIICCACGQMIDGIIFFGVFIPLRSYYYPRICIIVVGILFVSIIFFATSKFSLLFLIACTNVLVVISKFLEKRQEE